MRGEGERCESELEGEVERERGERRGGIAMEGEEKAEEKGNQRHRLPVTLRSSDINQRERRKEEERARGRGRGREREGEREGKGRKECREGRKECM